MENNEISHVVFGTVDSTNDKILYKEENTIKVDTYLYKSLERIFGFLLKRNKQNIINNLRINISRIYAHYLFITFAFKGFAISGCMYLLNT